MTDVLIAGAGPAGLVLAIELARRGVDCRIVDRGEVPAIGSRGDGLQPRTLEVFEDLGVLDRVLATGSEIPLMRTYAGDEVVWEGRMAELVEPTPDVPYPNAWCLPQWLTEQVLRDRLAELGVRVEFGTELVGFTEDGDGVAAVLRRDGVEQRTRARYLVGADGGRSTVRKALGIDFVGETIDLPGTHLVVGDVLVDGLGREHTYGWGDMAESGIGLQPLPGTDDYVLTTFVSAEQPPTVDLEYLQRRLEEFAGRTDIRLRGIGWLSVLSGFNLRVAERFRSGRTFLVGDAAHVHPPTGGQGLNTSVQDSYNLGWKLAAVLGGADDALLDSYQAERRPVAEDVLAVSAALLHKHLDGDDDAIERGPETQQLGINYRGGPLSAELRETPDGVLAGDRAPLVAGDRAPTVLLAGDRAPDAVVQDASGETVRLFDLLRGPHWTLLTHGERPDARCGDQVRVVPVLPPGTAPVPGSIVDTTGELLRNYGLRPGTFALIRPDGYLGLAGDSAAALVGYLDGVLPASAAVGSR